MTGTRHGGAARAAVPVHFLSAVRPAAAFPSDQNPLTMKIHLFPALAAVFVATALPVLAQTSGTIEGRVLNATNGEYLNNARVTVEGTALAAFTNSSGDYRLYGVPAGSARLHVFYTGLAPQEVTINVTSGRTATHDFNLGAANAGPSAPPGNETVVLDQMVVSSQRDIDQKSIAINEQRFAPNLKTVVSSDQFGDVTEGNVGEFLKYLPGVSLEYTSPDARQIILRGVNPIYTAVYVDGFRMASAASSGSNRFFELEQASINNVSRTEVEFSRTPDIPADALGGSVNMISKSAFEASHRQFNYRTYLSANGDELAWGRTPGPASEASHHIKPGFDFSFVDPVSRRLGVVLNYSDSNIFYPQHRSQPTWTPVSNGAGGTVDNPFLRSYQMQDGPKNTERQSLGATIDWKPSANDTITFSPQWNYYNAFFGNRNLNWNVQGTSNTAPTAWDGPVFVQGAPGAGSASYGSSFRRKYGYTYQLDAIYRHVGPVWSYDGGLSFSHATNHYHDAQDGHFENVGLSLPNLTVRFDDIDRYDGVRPGTITTTNAAGTPVDTFANLGAFTLHSATFNQADSADVFKTAKVNAKRDVDLSFPATIKTGLMVQEQTRDIRKPNGSYTFVGPDGLPNTADDLASNYQIVDSSYSRESAPYGLPQVQWPSPYAVYSLFREHPDYFQLNQVGLLQNSMRNSQFIDERISAAYVLVDTRLLNNRLRMVYGFRAERTDDDVRGFLQDVNAIFQRDAGGNFLLDAAGHRVPITAPNGLPITDPSNALLLNQTEFRDRGLRAKNHYAGGFPSLNLTYSISDNFIARAAYSRATGRPDFGNIVPGTALPDPSSANPYAITVNNPALAPEFDDNYDLDLDYYFGRVGLLSVGLFRKDFRNFFGTSTIPATAELLGSLGVPDADFYLQNDATVTTHFNVGKARVTGVQLDYKQALTFLPVPGFSVFTSGYAVHLQGSPLADFTNFISKAFNAGVSYDRRQFGVKLNFNYRGTQRYGSTTYTDSAGTKVVSYEYYKPRPQLDLNFDYRFTPHLGLFVAARNITNVVQDDQRYAPAMPGFTHLYRREEFGTQYTAGFKGEF